MKNQRTTLKALASVNMLVLFMATICGMGEC
jgi:hypothetical protein